MAGGSGAAATGSGKETYLCQPRPGAVIVGNRFGVGFTFNFGNPVAWLVCGTIAAVPYRAADDRGSGGHASRPNVYPPYPDPLYQGSLPADSRNAASRMRQTPRNRRPGSPAMACCEGHAELIDLDARAL